MGHAPAGYFPILNRGGAANLYCFIFLYIVFAGGEPLECRCTGGAQGAPQLDLCSHRGGK